MPEIVTLGETMAAFAPQSGGPLRYIRDYQMRIAGSESNLAIGVEKLGHTAGWISRLGDDEFGHFVRSFIRGEGVDTSQVIMDEHTSTGLMFKEIGEGETKVFYYRSGSAASRLSPEDVCESYIQSAKLVYLTGITPVLSDSCRNAVERCFDISKEAGVPLCFDPNIRRRLWRGNNHQDLIRSMTLRSEIVLMGLDEAEILFGTRDFEAVFHRLFTEGAATHVALKNSSHGAWVGVPGEIIPVEPYPCTCIEPIGAGDAFNAGFLCGLLDGESVERCGQIGAICGALAVQTPGDIEGYPSAEQMRRLLAGIKEVYR